ncbi:MAG: hypothetical protein A3C06_00940 [Candidatus Taylorbacteria bacterium RIFCSPHIGHO2_02_FULL_46_13]|uniref:Uncharacterized protein n=2 Tax=Parcubacteria group TaxID=1794811 RepID=A0A1G2MTS7_9BACT|nr:MAG: hypothetical protein A3C06_00940 [Candidatus Taylorbacteria bacterium RIFCSPHIGHO2_02_FULL_46_13]
MSKKSISVLMLAVIALPVLAFAADNFVKAEIFSEEVERIIEVVNLVLALAAGVFAIKLAALAQGGTMEKTWNTLAVCSVLFVLLEVVGTLKGFEVVSIGGLGEIFEFLFVLTFVYCLYFTKKDLLNKMMR